MRYGRHGHEMSNTPSVVGNQMIIGHGGHGGGHGGHHGGHGGQRHFSPGWGGGVPYAFGPGLDYDRRDDELLRALLMALLINQAKTAPSLGSHAPQRMGTGR